eukprot:Phypoly_transcript_15311.p1 GENE.Phypoly_transcript_15311~~Phypoly_transcript_15311.p1  ORF type:complete len:233 (+),score=16.03 Phypoly_transcript_15311:55-699(+)
MNQNILPDVIAQGVSLRDLVNCALVCQEWKEAVYKRSNTAWRLALIEYLSGCYSENVGETQPCPDDTIEYWDINWVDATREILTKTFSVVETFERLNKIEMDRPLFEALSTHGNVGGVIDWCFFKPADILFTLYPDDLPTFIHEMAVIISISNCDKDAVDYNLLIRAMRKPRAQRPKYAGVDISDMTSPTEDLDYIVDSTSRPPYGKKINKIIK